MKLRIAIATESQSGFPVGSILFQLAACHSRDYYDNINLTGTYYCHSNTRVISTVIDTRTAKGDDTLGAFLMMVGEYRFHGSGGGNNRDGIGLKWGYLNCDKDPAYRALRSLYENGSVEDTITIEYEDIKITTNRQKAQGFYDAFGAKLKGE